MGIRVLLVDSTLKKYMDKLVRILFMFITYDRLQLSARLMTLTQ